MRGSNSEKSFHPWLAWAKALAIVAVVITHSGLESWDPRFSWKDVLVRNTLMAFHVPTFLFAAGFLYNVDTRASFNTIWTRLRRILTPYVIASLVAIASGLALHFEAMSVLWQLTTGAAFENYYYIFLAALFLPTIWLLSRMSRNARLLLLLLWMMQLGLRAYWPESFEESSFWALRNPLNDYHFSLLGWVARDHLGSLESLVDRPGVRACCWGDRHQRCGVSLAGRKPTPFSSDGTATHTLCSRLPRRDVTFCGTRP